MKTHRVLTHRGHALMVINKFKPGTAPGFTDVHEHVTMGTVETMPKVTDTQRLRALSLGRKPTR